MRSESLCEKCGESPTPFECGNDDFSETETGYYHTVPRRSEDPSTLMSNGDLVFKVCVTKTHPILKDEMHICSDCFLKFYGDTVKYTDTPNPFLDDDNEIPEDE